MSFAVLSGPCGYVGLFFSNSTHPNPTDSDAPSTDEDSEDDYIDEAEMKAPPVVKKGRR